MCANNFKELCTKYKCSNREELQIIALQKMGIDANENNLFDLLDNMEYNFTACKEDFEARVVV